MYISKKPKIFFLAGCSCLLVIAGLASIQTGTFSISTSQIIQSAALKLGLGAGNPAMTGHDVEVVDSIIWSIRVPRMLLAILTGAGLAVSGAAMQGLFRNPLADPSLIGVSAGAAMGAVGIIVLGGTFFQPVVAILGFMGIPLFAFIGGIAATWIVYSLSKLEGKSHAATMLLTGIAINALAAAFIGFLVYLSDDRELRSFTFWTLGSLNSASWTRLLAISPFICLPLALVPFFSRALNAFLLGEAEAGHLGYNSQQVKTFLVFLSASMVGATVAICGMIGFVGLIVPHLVRMVIGPDHRFLIPGSALLGGTLMLASDVFARVAVAPAELPIGVITAFIGAPFFLALLHFSKHRAWL